MDLSAAVLTNSGTITVSGDGDVLLGDLASNGGDIAVSGGGTLDLLTNSTTLTNTGTISVSSGGEVLLGTIASNTGSLLIGSGGTMAFETAAGTKTAVTFSGTGGTLELGLPSGTISTFGTIAGFVSGDTILLSTTPFINTGTTHVVSGKTLQIVESSTTVDLLFNTTITADPFQLSSANGGNSTAVTLRCFAVGTLIGTPNGETLVQELAVGDLVQAQDAGLAPVKWIGRRHVDCHVHPKPQTVWPVRVCAGAFADGLPHRDLWLSPDHAVYVSDVLIPIKHLANGTSIEQVPIDEVTYYHLELDDHDVLLAEGLPVESYLDIGGRFNFENGGGPIALHADFSTCRQDTAHMWEALGFARLIVAGPELDAARALVNTRATLVQGNRVDGVSDSFRSAEGLAGFGCTG